MRWIAAGALAASFSVAAATLNTIPAAPRVTAAEIVEKNIAARGGLAAWRKIETMVWTGHVENSQGSTRAMPFVLELKRPNKTHFEITALGARYTRIFDGTRGWRLRPGTSGEPETKAFSTEEVNFARDEFVIDGPLIDYEAKGITVSFGGTDQVEGRKAYLLNIKLPSGANRRVWIDAENFLEIRSERPSSSPLVKAGTVSVFYRDYRTIEGLQIPLTIESSMSVGGTATGGTPERLVIDKVAVNPSLPAQAFAKPGTQRHRRAMVQVGGDARTALPAPVRPSP